MELLYKQEAYNVIGAAMEVHKTLGLGLFRVCVSYYKTPRGYHKRSLNSNEGWNKTSSLSFINMPILQYSNEIRSAVLMVHGEKAHSRYYSEDAYKRLAGANKELLIVPGANHTDLYDNLSKIPFDKIVEFYNNHLK